jgi:hypothetical protein
MGNSENTAINELIARVSGGSTEPDTVVGPPPTEAQGSGHHPQGQRLGALQERNPMHTTIPGTTPVAAPFEPRPGLPTSYPVVPRALLGAVTPLAPDPVAPADPSEPHDDTDEVPAWAAPSGGPPWIPPDEPLARARGEGTLQLRRPSELRVVIGKLVLPVVLLVTAGVAIGAYFALGVTDPEPLSVASTTPTAAPPAANAQPAPPAASAQPAPPAASAQPAPPAEPAALPALVDVRIDSAPRGATVTLVDRGRSQFVGTTPVNVAVDPSREYELMFSYPNKPVHVERLDARTTRRVAVAIGKRAAARPPDGASRRPENATTPSPPAAQDDRPSDAVAR